jgi:hypothetical protein
VPFPEKMNQKQEQDYFKDNGGGKRVNWPFPRVETPGSEGGLDMIVPREAVLPLGPLDDPGFRVRVDEYCHIGPSVAVCQSASGPKKRFTTEARRHGEERQITEIRKRRLARPEPRSIPPFSQPLLGERAEIKTPFPQKESRANGGRPDAKIRESMNNLEAKRSDGIRESLRFVLLRVSVPPW